MFGGIFVAVMALGMPWVLMVLRISWFLAVIQFLFIAWALADFDLFCWFMLCFTFFLCLLGLNQ